MSAMTDVPAAAAVPAAAPDAAAFSELLTTLLRTGMDLRDASRGTQRAHPVEVYDAQVKVNAHLLDNKNVMNVVATAQGKTETFYLATRLLRTEKAKQAGVGPVVVFVPTNALLNDQIARAKEFGFTAVVYGNKADFKEETQEDIAFKLNNTNNIDIVFFTVDMMMWSIENEEKSPLMKVQQFTKKYKGTRGLWKRVPLVVIDEIHTIAEAGEKFFQSWMKAWRVLDEFYWYHNALKLGLTGTLDDDERVIVDSFIPGAENWELVPGGRLRANIALRVVPGKHGQATIHKWLREYITENKEESIIVFVNRKDFCGEYAAVMNQVPEDDRGKGQIEVYHADLAKDVRKQVEDRFRSGATRILVATKAIGVGFDKPDLRTVIHTFTPPTPTEYYQQLGRAGRDGLPAKAFLLPSNPFNKRTVENALILAGRFLYRCPDQTSTMEEITAAVTGLSDGQTEEATTSAAIRHAVQVGIFQTNSAGKVKFLGDAVGYEKYKAVLNGTTSNDRKLVFMKSLNRHGGDCIWRQLLQKLGDPTIADDFLCKLCTGADCDPKDSDDLPADAFAGRCFCSSRLTAKGRLVYGLHAPNVEVDMGPDRLRLFAAKFMEGYQMLPARWCISYVTDSDGRVRETANKMASALQLELVDFISLDPDIRLSMKDAVTDEQRAAVLRKYRFDLTKLPPPGTRVLLFDDIMKTGVTFDHAADELAMRGISVIGLVQHVYPWVTQTDVKDQIDMTQ